MDSADQFANSNENERKYSEEDDFSSFGNTSNAISSSDDDESSISHESRVQAVDAGQNYKETVLRRPSVSHSVSSITSERRGEDFFQVTLAISPNNHASYYNNENGDRNSDARSEGNSETYVDGDSHNEENEHDIHFVDPLRAIIIPIAEADLGENEEERPFRLKVGRLVLCDDSFLFLINMKLCILIIGIVFICSIYIISKDRPSMRQIPDILFQLSNNHTDDSPQQKALQWMLHNDEISPEQDRDTLVQRYVLMTFFFSLSGEIWRDKKGFGSKMHECSWMRLICEDFEVVEIRMATNNLRGQLPTELGLLQNLVSIDLRFNKLTGSIPPQVGHLKSLQNLFLGHNQLSSMSDSFFTNNSLQHFTIYNNTLEGTLNTNIGKMRQLKLLNLGENEFSGTIPSELQNLKDIEDFRVVNTKIHGTVPSFLGEFPSLKILRLHENKLTGTLPSILGNLSQLKEIFLSVNKLTGTIPDSLYQLTEIESFIFNNNLLSGTIPHSIGFKNTVETFMLSYNNFSGIIPNSIGEFTQVTRLNLHWTSLSGVIPSIICAYANTEITNFTADCAGENPKVRCSCCNMCL